MYHCHVKQSAPGISLEPSKAAAAQQDFGRSGPWVALSTAACILFGVALILNVHPIGDGLWYWYATAVRQHARLYSDLHLNQQPLFVLLTAAFQRICGTSWLASKIFPALQAVAYCSGLFLLSTFVPWRAWQRALLLTAAFGMALTNPFYRFDDYHVTTQCFQAFSLYLLLVLWRRNSAALVLPVAAGLGVLCGLATANRLNDGAGLTLACLLAFAGLSRGRRLLGLGLLAVLTGLTLLAVVLLTGDSIGMWWYESVAHASRIKGGAGNILLLPFAFPFRVAISALQPKGLALLAGVVLVFVLFRRAPSVLTRGARLRNPADWLAAFYLVLLLAFFIWQGTKNLANAKLGQFLALLAVGAGIWVHARLALQLAKRQAQEHAPRSSLIVLLLIPFWALMAAAMTAGIHLPDYASPVAFLLLLLPIALPWHTGPAWCRRGWLVLSAMVVAAALPAKILVPYDWHHFHSDRMFKDRAWYQHPDFGPMYLDRSQLALMTATCKAVHDNGQAVQLLSTPYPYANYFCNVPPWRGYVQTWFDTSSREQIEQLTGQLSTKPPEWVFYQRALDTLRLHEDSYSKGQPLAQRGLDTAMMSAIAEGRWTIVQRACFGGSDWLLLRTSPPGSGEHQGNAADATDRMSVCSGTETPYQERRF